MKQIFNPEDFNHTIYRDMTHDQIVQVYCDTANFKVNQLIESWPVVYGIYDRPYLNFGHLEEKNNTHKAMLAFIEEIVKEPCKHSVGMRQDRTPEWIVSVNWEGQIICEHCGVELIVEWKEKI
jgi:hypothetical protein